MEDKGLVVMSVFDGVATGLEALNQLNIPIKEYHTSEIDKHSSAIARYRHPNIIEHGDITLSYFWDLPKIDLMLGGFPCQNFSIAGNRKGFNGKSGSLFYNMVDTFNMFKPKYFLFENVLFKGKMKDSLKVINNMLGVEPIMIDSRLLSGQSRKRLYWTNIPGVKQPLDLNISLKSILENGDSEIGGMRGRYMIDGKRGDNKVGSLKDLTSQKIEIRKDGKSNCLTTVCKDNLVIVKRRAHGFDKGCHEYRFKSDTLRISTGTNYKVYDGVEYRYLTPLEYERLQTMIDNYTKYGNYDGIIKEVPKTYRKNSMANGWTLRVIKHILKGLK